MKYKCLIVTSVLTSIVTLLAGCGSLLTQQQTPVFDTNAVTGQVTQTLQTQYVPNTNLVANLQAAQEVAGVVPSSWGEVASGALALALAGLGFYAKAKTKLANDSQTAAQTATDALHAAIAGVEASGSVLVKQNIQNQAASAGVSDFLDSQVQAVTKQMVSPPPKP